MIAPTTLEQVMASWGASHRSIIKPELIRHRLKKGNQNWIIQLVEFWPDDFNQGASNLDSKVNWTEKVLSTWPRVRRTSWDMWVFDKKRDAEKFITLFNLTWA